MKRMVNVLFAGVLAMTVLSCGEEKKGYTLNGEIWVSGFSGLASFLLSV